MKKKEKHKKKRRNAAPVAVAAPPKRRSGGARGGAAKEGAKTLLAAVAGGVASALAAGAAVEAGMKPQTAAVVTLVGGAATAYGLKGYGRAAGVGATCMAAGQLALAWQVKRQADARKKAEEKAAGQSTLPASPTPNALPAPAGAAPKRNGYDDDGSEDPRNAGVVEDYANDDGYSQAA